MGDLYLLLFSFALVVVLFAVLFPHIVLFSFPLYSKYLPINIPFSRVSQKDSLFSNYDDSVLFTRAYFRFDETLFREAQNHSSWDRMDAMECKARRRSFFMKGFSAR